VKAGGSFCPSEYRFRCSAVGVSASDRPPEISYSFRVPRPLSYRPYRLSGPTLPLVISSTVWFSHNEFRLVTIRFQIKPSLRVSPPFRVLPNKTSPFGRSQSAPLMGFCSLQHMKDRRSTYRGFAHPLRSAFRV
jgi:hypothetical protein